jgi:hypothetical protein
LTIHVHEADKLSLEQIGAFLNASQEIQFEGETREQIYQLDASTCQGLGFTCINREAPANPPSREKKQRKSLKPRPYARRLICAYPIDFSDLTTATGMASSRALTTLA